MAERLQHGRTFKSDCWAVAVVVAWQLDLQLPMQSVHIITNALRVNPAHCKVYPIQHYVIQFVNGLRQVGGFLGLLRVPPSTKADFHNIKKYC